jgi:hypothetical protein
LKILKRLKRVETLEALQVELTTREWGTPEQEMPCTTATCVPLGRDESGFILCRIDYFNQLHPNCNENGFAATFNGSEEVLVKESILRKAGIEFTIAACVGKSGF